MDASLWPLFGLRLRLDDIELRLPTDSDLERLVRLARRGIHDPEVMPFQVPWTDSWSPQFERQTLQYNWRTRAEWRPEKWALPLMATLAGEPVGVQEIRANRFAELGIVDTGSWLGRDHQGLGIGTRMRLAVLHLAFERLGAVAAESNAFDDNPASRRVSLSVGYVENGWTLQSPRGTPRRQLRFIIDRAGWQSRLRPRVDIDGLDPCLAMLGVASDPGAIPAVDPSE